MTGATPAGHQEGGCGSFYAKIQVICVEMQSRQQVCKKRKGCCELCIQRIGVPMDLRERKTSRNAYPAIIKEGGKCYEKEVKSRSV